MRHQRDQGVLAALIRKELARLWPSLLQGGLPLLGRTISGLLTPYAQASASLAAEFYEAEREGAQARTRFTVPVVAPPPLEQIEASVGWATRSLRAEAAAPVAEDLERPVADDDALESPQEAVERVRRERQAAGQATPQADVVEGESPEEAVARVRRERALTLTQGVVQKLVTDAGRRTLAEAVTADPAAVAWARVPTGATTCSFCALMCIRGAVYKSELTAGGGANQRFVGDGEFKFHDNDDCTIVPIFDGQAYEPPSVIEAWEQLYYQSTTGASGADARRAFRRAFEGRTA